MTGAFASAEVRPGPQVELRRSLLGTDRRISNLELVWWAAVIGVVVAAVLTLDARGWSPVGDDAVVVTRAGDVFSSDPPLLGMPTSLPTESGAHTHHPGPLLFVWLAPFVAAFGGVTGGALGAAAANLVAVAAIWWFGREGLGRLAGITLGTVGLMVASGVAPMYLPLNSSLSAAATLATLTTAWAVLLRVPGAAFALVWFASWCAQSHVAYGIVAMTVAGPVLGWELLRRWRTSRRLPAGETAIAVAPLPLFALLLWSGPLLEGGRNLWNLLGAQDPSGLPARGPAHAARTLIGVLGRWPFASSSEGAWDWSPAARDAAVLFEEGPSAGEVLIVCAAAVLLLWAWRRRVPAARSGSVVLGFALLGTFVATAASPERDPLEVQLFWARCVSILAVTLYVVAARPLWQRLVREPTRAVRVARGCAAIVVISGVLLVGTRLSGLRWSLPERVLAEQMTKELSNAAEILEPVPLALVALGGVATPGATAAEQSAFGAAARRLESGRPTLMDAEWYWGRQRSLRGLEEATPTILVTSNPPPADLPDDWVEVASVVPLRLATPDLPQRVAEAASTAGSPLTLVPGAASVAPTVVDGLLPGSCEDPAEWLAEPSRFAEEAPRALVELYRAGLVESPPLPSALADELWRAPLEGLWAYRVDGRVPQDLARTDRLVLDRAGCR